MNGQNTVREVPVTGLEAWALIHQPAFQALPAEIRMRIDKPTKQLLAIGIILFLFPPQLLFPLIAHVFSGKLSLFLHNTMNASVLLPLYGFSALVAVVVFRLAFYFLRLQYRYFCQPKSYASKDSYDSSMSKQVKVTMILLGFALFGISAILITTGYNETQAKTDEFKLPFTKEFLIANDYTDAEIQPLDKWLQHPGDVVAKENKNFISAILYNANFPFEAMILILDFIAFIYFLGYSLDNPHYSAQYEIWENAHAEEIKDMFYHGTDDETVNKTVEALQIAAVGVGKMGKEFSRSKKFRTKMLGGLLKDIAEDSGTRDMLKEMISQAEAKGSQTSANS